jgi:hypothetical protein
MHHRLDAWSDIFKQSASVVMGRSSTRFNLERPDGAWLAAARLKIQESKLSRFKARSEPELSR